MIEIIKTKKFQIEVLWCALSGVFFTVIQHMFEAGSSNEEFKWRNDIFSAYRWEELREPNVGNFIFGFVFASVIIWSVKIYRKE